MFLEKLFGNTFGYVWLIIFMVASLLLIVVLFAKKERTVNNAVKEVSVEKEEIIEEVKETLAENVVEPEKIVEEKVVMVEEVKVEEGLAVDTVQDVINGYEIVKSVDGFYRVRKVGSDRTLRKVSTKIEAENFIEKRGLKND